MGGSTKRHSSSQHSLQSHWNTQATSPHKVVIKGAEMSRFWREKTTKADGINFHSHDSFCLYPEIYILILKTKTKKKKKEKKNYVEISSVKIFCPKVFEETNKPSFLWAS